MLLKNKNFQQLHRLHRWLGLILSVHILLLALSGVILVFHEELSPQKPSVSSTATRQPLQSMVDSSRSLYPHDRVLAIGVDEDHPQRLTLRLGKDGNRLFRGARRLHFDRSTGELQQEGPSASGFIQTVLVLHRELFLGTWGKLYVGILGLVYAFILISGMFIYGPLMKRMSFGTLRAHLRPRVWWTDVHKYFGAVTFGWSLVIGLTGFMLGWSGPLIKFYQASALKGLTAEFSASQPERRFISVDQALAAAEAASPSHSFSFVAFPETEFSTASHYIFVLTGTSDLFVVNAYDGHLERVLVLPWYLRLLLVSEPLHFGDYGGLAMKILWVLFGLSATILPLSGLQMVWQRMRPPVKAARFLQPKLTKSTAHRPYSWPLILLLLCWSALILALQLDGIHDLWANGLLASVLLLSLWFLRRNKRAALPE